VKSLKKIPSITVIAGAAILVACGGGSLDVTDTSSGSSVAAGAIAKAFEDTTDEAGKTVTRLKQVVALSPIVNGSLKPYFEARKIEIIQAKLEDITHTQPAVLYIDTSQYNTDSESLKAYLLKFRGVLILDGAKDELAKPSVTSKMHNAAPQLTATTTDDAAPDEGVQQLKNAKAAALLLNLGKNGIPDSDVFIATRKTLWVSDGLLINKEDYQKELDSSLKRMVLESNDSGSDIAAAAAGDKFWNSGETYVDARMAHGWWVRYSVSADALHNKSGGYQKLVNVRVNANGYINEQRMGFRRGWSDVDPDSGEIKYGWNTQQWDDWGWAGGKFRMHARFPFGFETQLKTTFPRKSVNAQVREVFPDNLHDERFKVGKEKTLKAVIGASATVPGGPFGINAGIPLYTGGYTDIWQPTINKDHKRTYNTQTKNVSISNTWAIGLNDYWNTSGILAKGFNNDKRAAECDVQGHHKGGCLNERINALSKDGYKLSVGAQYTVDRFYSPYINVQVKQHLRLVTCSIKHEPPPGQRGPGYLDDGCSHWEDSIHWKTLTYRLVSKDGSALAKGAEAHENVTGDELQKALFDF
jgi:hypothetical protein